MATYNGEEFIRAQLDSIVSQLEAGDEIVIVDDGSQDDTVRVIQEVGDQRIRVYAQANAGVIPAFERAIGLGSNSVTVLADQDDLWPSDRLTRLAAALDKAPLSAGALATIGDDPGRRLAFRSETPRRAGAFLDILLGRAPYYGSCMAFGASVREMALPFPPWIEAHDHWLAVCGLAMGRPHHLPEVVTLRRVHEKNLSTRSRREVRALLRTRLIMLRMAVAALRRRFSSSRPHRSDDL